MSNVDDPDESVVTDVPSLYRQILQEAREMPPVEAIIGALAADDPFLGFPLVRLDLGVRTRNVFSRHGLTLVRDLKAFTDESLMSLPRFGFKCLSEVKGKLMDRVGLPVQDWPTHPIKRHALDDGSDEGKFVEADDQEQKGVAPGRKKSKKWLPDIDPGQTVADEIQSIAAAVMGHRGQGPGVDRNIQIVRARYGLDGEAKTLEEIAQPLGMTRERIRQIVEKIPTAAARLVYSADKPSHQARLKESLRPGDADCPRNPGNHLDDILGPYLTVRDAAKFYRDVFGLSVLDEDLDTEEARQAKHLMRRIRALAWSIMRAVGAVNVSTIIGLGPEQTGVSLTRDDVLRALRSDGRFVPLHASPDWYWSGPTGKRSRFLKEAEKMLICACGRLDLYEMMAVFFRSRSSRDGYRLEDHEAINMPFAVAKEIMVAMPWVRQVQYNDFLYVGDRTPADVLNPSEIALVEAIHKLGGVASRVEIVRRASADAGQLANTMNIGLQTATVVAKVGFGVYAVIGTPMSRIAEKLARMFATENEHRATLRVAVTENYLSNGCNVNVPQALAHTMTDAGIETITEQATGVILRLSSSQGLYYLRDGRRLMRALGAAIGQFIEIEVEVDGEEVVVTARIASS